MNFHDAGLLRGAIAGARLRREPGLAAKLRTLHLFILNSRLRPGADAPPPPVFKARLSALNPPAARLLLAGGRAREAEAALAETLRAFPLDENACGLMAEALLCSGRGTEAFRLMAGKARALRSPGFRAWRGQLLLFTGRYAEALRELGPGKGGASPMSACWRGAALSALGRTGEALRELRAALSADPDDLEARVWFAETLLKSGRSSAASAEARKVLNKEPGNPWALLISGLARPGGGNAPFRRAARTLTGRGAGAGPDLARALLEKARGCRRCEKHFLGLAKGGI